MSTPTFEIPKECKAGVVYNEGPNFELKVEMVPVPEPGKYSRKGEPKKPTLTHYILN